jgi:hypothetical protein
MRRAFEIIVATVTLAYACGAGVFGQSTWQMKSVPIQSRWAKEVSPGNALPEYPRPQMVRTEWENLNGLWEYAISLKDEAKPVAFSEQILVPYPIESALSGVKKPLLPGQRLWYRRTFRRARQKSDGRVLLHFGAVDWQATIYINGREVGRHQGGYQQFSFDITDSLRTGDNELVVSVWDPTDAGPNPHGKQILTPYKTLFTAASGIWQTVWLETVPPAHIDSIYLTPDVDNEALRVLVRCSGCEKGDTIEAIAKSGDKTISMATAEPGEELNLQIVHPHLWFPDDPFLYDLSVRLLRKSRVGDSVGSYFGMRKIEVKNDAAGITRIFLNGRYMYNLGVLDQGYWPEGIYTAPTDAALRFDIEAIKSMGFNMIRKHLKIEPDRWYYYCDKLGMLIWQDMPQPSNVSPEAKAEFETETAANVEQLHNFPSIVAWVLFNEDWGAYDQERLAKWMKLLDPSRLLNGHTGGTIDDPYPGQDVAAKWISSDMTDIHTYPGPKMPPREVGKAQVLGEFGGIGAQIDDHVWDFAEGWGYLMTSPAGLAEKYQALLNQLKQLENEGLSASVYTQPFDAETEENGLMTYDRELIKIPLAKLRAMNEWFVPPTTNRAFDSAEFRAKTAEAAYPNGYESLRRKYENGRRDPQFVRSLARRARMENDEANALKISADYIANQQDLYTAENLEFLRDFATPNERGFNDKGMRIFYRNGEKADRIMNQKGYSQAALDSIITRTEIGAFVSRGGGGKASEVEPDWAMIMERISGKYGVRYARYNVLRAKATWYEARQHWQACTKTGSALLENSGSESSPVGLNEIAWVIFQHSEDKAQLEEAVKWSWEESQRHPQDGNRLDTYAHLLYKLGRKTEALESQQRAITITQQTNTPFLKEMEEDLQKMKRRDLIWLEPDLNPTRFRMKHYFPLDKFGPPY